MIHCLNRGKIIAIFSGILGICCADLSAAESPTPVFKGQLGLGGQVAGIDASNVVYDAALAARTSRAEGSQVALELAADQATRELTVKEGFLSFREPCARGQLRAGRGRKVLGWEYEYPDSTRLTVLRPTPYDFLAERSLAGHEYFASFDWYESRSGSCVQGTQTDSMLDSEWFNPRTLVDPDSRLHTGLSLTFDESNDYTLIAKALLTTGPHWRLGAWVLGEQRQTRDVHRPLIVWASVLSALYQAGSHRAEMEGFWGHDPLATENERELGRKDKIQFASALVKYGLYLKAWNPYIVGGILLQDLTREKNLRQGTAGLRYFFRSQLTFTAEFNYEPRRGIGQADDDYFGRVIGRYFF